MSVRLPPVAVTAPSAFVELEDGMLTVPDVERLQVFQLAPVIVIPLLPPARVAVFPLAPVRFVISSPALPLFVIVQSAVNVTALSVCAVLALEVIPAPALVIVPFPEYE